MARVTRLPGSAGKLAGLDKKLSRSLEEEVAAGSASPTSLSKSPVGPLHESGSRKTLVYLILTLNHIYPDYDFSLLRAHHFKKEEGVAAIEETIDAHLVEASKVGARLTRLQWRRAAEPRRVQARLGGMGHPGSGGEAGRLEVGLAGS